MIGQSDYKLNQRKGLTIMATFIFMILTVAIWAGIENLIKKARR